MPESDLQPEQTTHDRPVVLLSGATGYIGSRVLPLLELRDVRVRCLARKPEKLQPEVGDSTEVVKGDVLDRPSLDEALSGVTTAYYLVHLMASSADFEQQDREAAENFGAATKEAGVQRIIYMGGWARKPILSYLHTFAAAMKSEKSCVIRVWKPSNFGHQSSLVMGVCHST